MRQLYRVGRNIWRLNPLRWFMAVGLAAIAGIIAGHTVIAVSGSVCVVDGSSMAPTFLPGSRVYTTPISTPLKRGDIVLVDDGNKQYALKRIIALPGETIQMWRGYVFIDRKMLKETYLGKYTFTFADPLNELSKYKLAPEQYFVMGDNREYSVDSRRYGPVDRSQLKGRIPSFGSTVCAYFSAYTLPTPGKRNIKAL